MVNSIDIKKLNLEELLGVVSLYPWFGMARKEIGRRMAEMGAWTREQFAEASLYVSSRRKMYEIMTANKDADFRDGDAQQVLKSILDNGSLESGEDSGKPKIMVVGGDYFSQSQYNSVRHSEDGVFPSFATKGNDYVENQSSDDFDLFTETLAQIYLEQDYVEEAKRIYLKLIERYPEKAEHFRSMVRKIDNA